MPLILRRHKGPLVPSSWHWSPSSSFEEEKAGDRSSSSSDTSGIASASSVSDASNLSLLSPVYSSPRDDKAAAKEKELEEDDDDDDPLYESVQEEKKHKEDSKDARTGKVSPLQEENELEQEKVVIKPSPSSTNIVGTKGRLRGQPLAERSNGQDTEISKEASSTQNSKTTPSSSQRSVSAGCGGPSPSSAPCIKDPKKKNRKKRYSIFSLSSPSPSPTQNGKNKTAKNKRGKKQKLDDEREKQGGEGRRSRKDDFEEERNSRVVTFVEEEEEKEKGAFPLVSFRPSCFFAFSPPLFLACLVKGN